MPLEEAVQEVKRAAVAEVQRAVAVALTEVVESRERVRVNRYLDLSQRNQEKHYRLNPYIGLSASQLNTKHDANSVTTTTTPASSTNVSANEEAGNVVSIIVYVSDIFFGYLK